MFIHKIEDVMVDSAIPKFFEQATGRKYTDRETCVNDIRRLLLHFWNSRLKEKLTSPNKSKAVHAE
jgi:hypothetical protein